MPSPALATFNDAIDALSISAARKAEAKAAGQRLYIAGAKETIAHLRKHVLAASTDDTLTQAQRDRAAAWIALIDGMRTRQDSWWLDIQALAEG